MTHATLPHPFHACTNGHGPSCEAFDCCHPCPMDSALEAHLAFLERTDIDPYDLPWSNTGERVATAPTPPS